MTTGRTLNRFVAFSSTSLDLFFLVDSQMLGSILELVTKSKRTLFTLQQKHVHCRRLVDANDIEWRRRYAELLTQTDDRIGDVRRKAGK